MLLPPPCCPALPLPPPSLPAAVAATPPCPVLPLLLPACCYHRHTALPHACPCSPPPYLPAAAALHTYLEVADVEKATVKGLKGLTYLDKVLGG